MFSYEDIRKADHEAAHAVMAWIHDVRVERCSIDHWSLKTGQAGLTATELHDFDMRPALEKARIRIMVTLAGPMTTPGNGCKDDVERATKWCEDYRLSLQAVFDATEGVIRSELFRVLRGAVQVALLEERELSEARVEEVLNEAVKRLPRGLELVKANRRPPTDAELRELITALEAD